MKLEGVSADSRSKIVERNDSISFEQMIRFIVYCGSDVLVYYNLESAFAQ